MPKLPWPKFLETCVQSNKNALLIAGQPPYWLCDSGLATSEVPPLDPEDITSMLAEIMPGPERIETVPGCRSFLLRHASKHHFRVDMLGEPIAHSVVLTKVPPDAPTWLREGSGWYRGWNAQMSKISWGELLTFAQRDQGEALVLPGSPPFGWSRWGLHAYGVTPLTPGVVRSMIAEIMPPPYLISQRPGLQTFTVHFGRGGPQFRAELFGAPSPALALLIRPRATPPVD
jgi:hypothetical protein